MIYTETLRADAYLSTRDIRKLKELRDNCEFWSRAVPAYRESWLMTMEYYNSALRMLGDK